MKAAFLGATAVALTLAGSVQAATVVLTFATNTLGCTTTDGGTANALCTTNGQLIAGDYGSTPELAVSYDASESSGSRTSLMFDPGDGGRAFAFPPGPPEEPSLIVFTPTTGYEVSFGSFTWSKVSATTSARFYFQVAAPGGAILFEGDNTGNNYAVNTNYYTGPVTFRFSNGGQGNVGIDQVSVAVRPTLATAAPEPATWAMLIGGFLGTGAMLRRRRALTA